MLIAYVGPFAYPSSNANSLRVKGVSEALLLAGHEVMICPGIMSSDKLADYVILPGVSIHQLNEYDKGNFFKLSAGIRGLFLGDVTLQFLKSIPRKPDVVILYGTHLGYLMRLHRYCRHASVRLILDVVEWYDPRHLPGGLIGPFALANELSMRWWVSRADGQLVISRYLERYYLAQGCNPRLVPPLFSEFPDRPIQLRAQNGLLNLCYTGTPGKKEEFDSILEGVRLAHAAGVKLKLNMIGVSASEFLAKYPVAASLMTGEKSVLVLHGRLSNHATRQLVAASDFLIIARRPLRFANAGFPFKIAESMVLGTPIITNCFSDICEYLKDGLNAVLMDRLDISSVFACIVKAAAMDERARLMMQNNARDKARDIFSAYKQSEIVNSAIMIKNTEPHK